MDSNMTFRIVESRPFCDAQGNRTGTTYTVFCEDEDGSSLVEIHADGDFDTLSPESQSSAPPAAYAAFVRLYLEWIEMSEDEQIEYARKNVVYAGKNHKRYANTTVMPFNKSGHEMYGEEFDGYVNEAWASLGEHFTNVDAFAVYLEKNYSKYSSFPMSGDILRRAAQNMMSRQRGQQKKASKNVSLDSPVGDGDDNDLDLKSVLPDISINLDAIITFNDFVDQIRANLKDDDAVFILDHLLSGTKKGRIAELIQEKRGVTTQCNSYVSRKIKFIGKVIDSIAIK